MIFFYKLPWAIISLAVFIFSLLMFFRSMTAKKYISTATYLIFAILSIISMAVLTAV